MPKKERIILLISLLIALIVVSLGIYFDGDPPVDSLIVKVVEFLFLVLAVTALLFGLMYFFVYCFDRLNRSK
jgi:hypothetical protein